MPTHLRKSHEDQGLLFQFVLSEFITAFQEVKALAPLAKATFRPATDVIIKSLNKLAGQIHDMKRLIAWEKTDGLLKKYDQACHLFAIASGTYEADELHEKAEEAWIITMECLSLAEMEETFEEPYSELCELMESSGFLIANLCEIFQNNENVLYFVLRHSQELALLMGEGFVKGIFNEGTERFLIEKYKERGFDEQLPEITSRFATL